MAVSAVVVATGLELYDASLSQEYGYGRYPNVFTGLEMERMTSPAGPGEGCVQRRSDGKAPARIAWLQCVGSRDDEHDYCSAFCCGYATRQAVLARQLLPEAEAHIYLMDDRVFAQSFSATYEPLRAAYGIRLSRNRPSVLREDPTTRDLLLQITDEAGHVVDERYDMVVLSVGAEGAGGNGELAAALSLTPDEHRFLRTGDLSPVDSGRDGIFVAGSATGPADVADSVTQGSAAAARVRAFLGYPSPGQVALAQPLAMPTERRLGVFACDCAGEIGSVIDLEATLAYARSLSGVRQAQMIPYGCLREGLETLRRIVAGEGLTDVVIGACKRRTYGALFARELGVPVQFAALREECASVHRDDPAGATRKARELLRIAIDRARRPATAVSPTIQPVRAALVVGGGLAGLTAALHLAEGGAPVHLVERELELGGNALRLGRTAQGEEIPAYARDLIARARAHPRITIHAATKVLSHTGRPGQFLATLRAADGRVLEVPMGATVVATGGEEYRGPVYGLGSSTRVLTLLDLEARLAAAPGLPSELRQVAFISCVGPWDEPGSSWAWRCSRTCCGGIIRQATAIKQANPACQVFVLSREVNTYGLSEEQYTAARRAGVVFVRYDPTEPPKLAEMAGGLRLTVRDTPLREVIELYPDLVALGVAILPRAGAAHTAARLGILWTGEGFYRDWEAKTRPFASLEPGVFLCGLAQGPKPSRETIAQALAAANQALTLLSEQTLAPAATVAEVDKRRCVACLTCVRTCPYGVPRIESERQGQGRIKGTSFIDPYRCQGCGVCAGECPEQAIAMTRYSDEQLLGDRLLGQWLVAADPT